VFLKKKTRVVYVKTWYEKIGFEKNPFETDPLKDEVRTLVGREKEAKEVIYRILSQNMLFIEGKKGSGKTALLKHAIDNFEGKGKVIYVDSNAVNKKLNIEKILSGAKKESTKEKYPKNMILLLDNVEELSKLNNERIKYLFDQNFLKSVIFTGNSYEAAEFTESVRSRIGNRIIRLTSLSDDDAVELLKERLGEKNEDMWTDQVIREIYSRTDGDLKKFLMDAYLVADCAANEKSKRITKQLIEKALIRDTKKIKDFAETLKLEKEISKETRTCEDCQGELKKFGEYYRCENCDTFCTECGCIIDAEDTSCPECGANFDE
jgi:chromosomal replication initiation ATPase DnaA